MAILSLESDLPMIIITNPNPIIGVSEIKLGESIILGAKSGLIFIIFTNLHLMIGVSEIYLDKLFSPAKSIQRFINERQ